MRRAALAAAVAALLAGCGSQHAAPPRQPQLPHALAAAWRLDADAVAAALAVGDGCLAEQRAVALRTAVIAAVNARRLAPRFEEPLVGAVNDLASRVRCVPAPAPAPAPAHDDHGHGYGHGHGKHKGHAEGHD
jgi:uncharacterized lipoprotein YmbA